MVVEIKNKDIEEFLSSYSYKELIDFVESALKDKILVNDAKKAVLEIKNGKVIDEKEFFARINNEN
jgi:hypothetical protein